MSAIRTRYQRLRTHFPARGQMNLHRHRSNCAQCYLFVGAAGATIVTTSCSRLSKSRSAPELGNILSPPVGLGRARLRWVASSSFCSCRGFVMKSMLPLYRRTDIESFRIVLLLPPLGGPRSSPPQSTALRLADSGMRVTACAASELAELAELTPSSISLGLWPGRAASVR